MYTMKKSIQREWEYQTTIDVVQRPFAGDILVVDGNPLKVHTVVILGSELRVAVAPPPGDLPLNGILAP